MGEGRFVKLLAAIASVYVAYTLAAHADSSFEHNQIRPSFNDGVGGREKRSHLRKPIIIGDSHIVNIDDPLRFMPRKKIIIQAPTKFAPTFSDPYPLNDRKFHANFQNINLNQRLIETTDDKEELPISNKDRKVTEKGEQLLTLSSEREHEAVGDETLIVGPRSSGKSQSWTELTDDVNDLSRTVTPMVLTSTKKSRTSAAILTTYGVATSIPNPSNKPSSPMSSKKSKFAPLKSPFGGMSDCRLVLRKRVSKPMSLKEKIFFKASPTAGPGNNVVLEDKVQAHANDFDRAYCMWCGGMRKCVRGANDFLPYIRDCPFTKSCNGTNSTLPGQVEFMRRIFKSAV